MQASGTEGVSPDRRHRDRPPKEQKRRMRRGSFVLVMSVALALQACASAPPRDTASGGDELADALYPLPPDTAEEVTVDTADDTEPETTGDLWDRMRSQFALPSATNAKVAASTRRYAANPQFLSRVVDRAEPYLHLIVDEIEQRGMPGELALLPVVESEYKPNAYSRDHASGLWQFIPGTGRHFGLKQTFWYDGRRDVVASTEAALDYLQELHDRFGGDWLLALAAYNSGEGTVRKAMKRNRRIGRPTDFWHLHLPAETRSYIPKLLAVSSIVADPESYGISLRPIPDEPFLASVELDSQLDLQLAAELAGLSLKDLCRYNPGYRRGVTGPTGPHRLLLPLEAVPDFEQRLAELKVGDRTRWTRYQVRRGDTLFGIATRYGTNVALLRELNGLRSNMLIAGSSILIPVSLPSTSNRQASKDEMLASEPRAHTVVAGETLWEIARRSGTSVQQLAVRNQLKSADELQAGQVLMVGTASEPHLVRYTVRRGDSLTGIARHFHVSVGELRKWNTLPHADLLHPGQQLIIYLDSPRPEEI